MQFPGTLSGFMQEYVLTTDPLGDEPNSMFEGLSIRKKTLVVLQNLILWACFCGVYILVNYAATCFFEPFLIVVNTLGEIIFWILCPVMGDDVYGLDTSWIRGVWYVSWLIAWLLCFRFAQGVIIFEIACFALFVSAVIQIAKIFFLGLPLDGRFYNIHKSADSLAGTFRMNNEFSRRAAVMQLLGFDSAMRLQFGTWIRNPAALSFTTDDMVRLLAYLSVYTFLSYFVTHPRIQGAVAKLHLPFKRLLRPPCNGCCNHKECSICLDTLCASEKTTSRLKLSVKRAYSRLRISASTHKNKPVVTLVCDHAYHEPCIDRWLKYRASCPSCRANIGDNKASVRANVFSIGLHTFLLVFVFQLCMRLIDYFSTQTVATVVVEGDLVGTKKFFMF